MLHPMTGWLGCGLGFALVAGIAVAATDTAPWDAEIRAFEVQDRTQPPPRQAILFVGSSSIKMWDLAASFPHHVVINRGFGGSQLADSTLYAGRIIIPYKPRLIVLYAGDNDIAAGKTQDQVARDFSGFVRVIRGALPETPILFLSIKPSPQRWLLYPIMIQANALIRTRIRKMHRVKYLEVGKPLLGKDGTPRPELYEADGLHLNPTGYAIWAKLLEKELR